MREEKLHLTISSPEKELFNGEVSVVTLPGTAGTFNVLPHHAPIVSTLKPGTILYMQPDGTTHSIEVRGGFVEMSNNALSVCIA